MWGSRSWHWVQQFWHLFRFLGWGLTKSEIADFLIRKKFLVDKFKIVLKQTFYLWRNLRVVLGRIGLRKLWNKNFALYTSAQRMNQSCDEEDDEFKELSSLQVDCDRVKEGSNLSTKNIVWHWLTSLVWFGKMTEAFLVDPSKHMNDLTRLIIGGGDGFKIPDSGLWNSYLEFHNHYYSVELSQPTVWPGALFQHPVGAAQLRTEAQQSQQQPLGEGGWRMGSIWSW